MVELLHVVIIVLLRLRVIKAFYLSKSQVLTSCSAFQFDSIQEAECSFEIIDLLWVPSRNYPISSFSISYCMVHNSWTLRTGNWLQARPLRGHIGGLPDCHGEDACTWLCSAGLQQFMFGTNCKIWRSRGKKKARLIISDLVWKNINIHETEKYFHSCTSS